MGIQYQEEQIGGVFADRYELRSLLGDGGMGRVYLAADRMLGGELVALKILHPSLCSDPRYTQRFLREVQVTRRVTHPNVVRTYDIGTFDGRVFFTMEYAEGKTLKEVLSASRVGPAEVCDILQQICQGLSLIHAEGVVHRDLKPGNVILSPEGVVKLTDFGIARTGFSDITGHNEVVGSAAYMAPEAWLGKQIDQRTDIYALGILCYELLTGTLPFDAESPPQMMCLHLQETPAPIRLKASAVPEWLEQIVFRMIQKEPENRFQNVDQILGVLNGAGSPEPETAPESAILSSVHVAEVEQDPKTVVRPKKQGKQKRFSSSSLLPSPKLLNLGTAIAVILLFERALAWSDPFALGFVSQSMSSLALVFAGALLVGLYALVAATPALALLSFYRGIRYAFSAWLKVAFTLVVATIAVIATDVYSLYELSIKTASKPEVARKIGSRRIPEFIFKALEPRATQLVAAGLLVPASAKFSEAITTDSIELVRSSATKNVPSLKNLFLSLIFVAALSFLLAGSVKESKLRERFAFVQITCFASVLVWSLLSYCADYNIAAFSFSVANLELCAGILDFASAGLVLAGLLGIFTAWKSLVLRRVAKTNL